jgi:hypothetical protein
MEGYKRSDSNILRAIVRVLGWAPLLLVSTAAAFGQGPADEAWTILQTGAANNSTDHRAATMRVLQLIPGNAKAVAMAEKGLQDKESEVRGALAEGSEVQHPLTPGRGLIAQRHEPSSLVCARLRAVVHSTGGEWPHRTKKAVSPATSR